MRFSAISEACTTAMQPFHVPNTTRNNFSEQNTRPKNFKKIFDRPFDSTGALKIGEICSVYRRYNRPNKVVLDDFESPQGGEYRMILLFGMLKPTVQVIKKTLFQKKVLGDIFFQLFRDHQVEISLGKTRLETL